MRTLELEDDEFYYAKGLIQEGIRRRKASGAMISSLLKRFEEK